ncbi:hypothetical protein ACJMK2_012116 [Sinanodonta woodiana]|uniref:Uncharacterized protein n=1 Tax=Sinanodonta woodiana TaxID=1069815 RepID=A0ABD3V8S7_SINWO
MDLCPNPSSVDNKKIVSSWESRVCCITTRSHLLRYSTIIRKLYKRFRDDRNSISKKQEIRSATPSRSTRLSAPSKRLTSFLSLIKSNPKRTTNGVGLGSKVADPPVETIELTLVHG